MLTALSPKTQEYMNQQDPDATFYEWQIPEAHKEVFSELVNKGYLVKSVNNSVASYAFTEEVRQQYGLGAL